MFLSRFGDESPDDLRKVADTMLTASRQLCCACPIADAPLKQRRSQTRLLAGTASRSRRMFRARFAINVPPSPIRGSGECRVRAAPAVSRAKCIKEGAHEHTGSAEAIRHSPRNGLRLIRALPGDRLVDTVTGEKLRQLDASVEASGPHDFAVRKSM